MIGRLTQSVSLLLLLAGCFCVLCALGTVLWRDSQPLNEKDLRTIVKELMEKTRNSGYVRAFAVAGICVFAFVMFSIVPLQHQIITAPPKVAHWWYFPPVPEVMPADKYVVLHMDKSDPLYGTRSRYTFCKAPDIDEREMVRDIVYKDHGDCIELVKYNYEREDFPPYRVKKYPEEAFNANR